MDSIRPLPSVSPDDGGVGGGCFSYLQNPKSFLLTLHRKASSQLEGALYCPRLWTSDNYLACTTVDPFIAHKQISNSHHVRRIQMQKIHYYLILLLLVSAVAWPSSNIFAASKPSDIIGYVFAKDALIQPDEVAAEKLTRINYAFADIKNGVIMEGFQNDRQNFLTLNGLKKRNPQLKILVSVGGWTWSKNFSDMVLTRESRMKFIESSVQFIQTHKLDGLDIDWEYPGLPGDNNVYRPEDKQNFTALVKELRTRFNQEEKKLRRHLFTTIAAGASQDFVDHTEMALVQRYLDTINLMTYDFYEAGPDKTTGHHACLYTNPVDPKKISADVAVKVFLRAGVPPKKIVLGVPFYGHAWGEVDPVNHGLFQPGKETTIHAGYGNIKEKYLNNGGFVRFWDKEAAAPYLWNESSRTFISYEDPESLKLKCQYVLKNKLGGIMFWEYYGDYHNELLNSINEGFKKKTGKQD
jgi:chitinase